MAEAEVIEGEVVGDDFEEWRSYLPEAERAKGVEANRREYEYFKAKDRRDDINGYEETGLAVMPMGDMDIATLERGMALVKRQYELIDEFVKSTFKNGVDYGPPFPGSKTKTLLKPGAEKFHRWFGLRPEFTDIVVEETPESAAYRIICHLYWRKSGELAGEGASFITTKEKKYRGREPDSINTIVKVGRKRALVDAVIRVGGLSHLFTQDHPEEDEVMAVSPVRTPPIPRKLQPPPDAADQARKAIIDGETTEDYERAVGTLGALYGISTAECKLAVKNTGATKEAGLTAEQALEAVNTLEAWYEGERRMEEEPSAEWQPEMPPEEPPMAEPPSEVPRVAGECVTDKQVKMLYAMMHKRCETIGFTEGIEPLKFKLRTAWNVNHVKEIPKDAMQEALQFIKGWKP